MYGLNNNTGMPYSQQNNNLQSVSKKQTSSNIGSDVKKTLDAIASFEGFKNGETGGERIMSVAKYFL